MLANIASTAKLMPIAAALALLAFAFQARAGGSPVPVAPCVPEFTIKPVVKRPCLLMDPEDSPEVKHRLEAFPEHPPADPRKMQAPLYGLLYGDEAFKKKVSAEFIANARKVFPLQIPGPTGSASALQSEGIKRGSSYRRYNEELYAYDTIASFGCLSEAEQKDFRDRMVAGAIHFVGDDPTKFPKLGNDNRSLDQALVGALVGLNFPDHPLAKAWVAFAANLVRQQLDNGVLEGAWNEVPRYHNWTMLLYSGFFQALQRRTGIDFYRHPKTKALLDWYVRFSSSLVRFPETTRRSATGEPTTPVWGDSNYGPMFEAMAIYAPHYVKTDPAFSKRLMWMWRRAGSPFQHGWHFDLIFPMLADPTLPDEPQALGSAFCKTMGYVLMRSGFNTQDETVVYMRGGRRGALHPRADLGSIDLFSEGIPLALGSQSGPYHDPEILWNRSQKSNNVVMFGGKSRDRGECSGTIDAYYTGPLVDYAVADCSRPAGRFVKQEESFLWRRHLLLVKQPDYLVIWDEISSPMPSQWLLHTTAESFQWLENIVTSHTAYNADLDIHVLLPTVPLVPNEKKGPFGGWFYDDPKKGKSDPYPFLMLKFVALTGKPGEHFLTVLHPRKAKGSALTAKLVSASKEKITVEIVSGDKADVITLGTNGASFRRLGSPAVSLPMRVDGNTEPGARFIPYR